MQRLGSGGDEDEQRVLPPKPVRCCSVWVLNSKENPSRAISDFFFLRDLNII